LRENELLYSSHLPLGVPNGLVIHHASSSFSGAVAGDLKKKKAPTSTILSHVNYAPAALFLAPLPGRK
jgi:hypothetical protein